MTAVFRYLRRFFTQWVAVDPVPSLSQLDRMDGQR